LGEGANNYNADNGFGGWFAYHGTFLVNDEPIMSGMAAGAGDFAFTVDCCPNYQIIRCWSAMDCSGNETSWCQTISYGDLNTTFNPSSAEVSSVDESKGDIAIVNIMPNPATSKSQISFMSKETGRLSLQIMDMTGRVVADLFNNTVEAGIVYKADFDADRIPSGIYMVRLNSGTATDIDRIQITK
jgi:Secretion system C-terminal sorting domain